jgi:hypothetical protein
MIEVYTASIAIYKTCVSYTTIIVSMRSEEYLYGQRGGT